MRPSLVSTFACTWLAALSSAAAPLSLPFWSDDAIVARSVAAERVADPESRVRALLFPADEMEVDRLLPAGSTLVSVLLAPPAVVIELELPPSFLAHGVDDELLERLSRQLDLGFEGLGDLRQIHLAARPQGDPQARFRLLPDFLATPVVPRQKPGETGLESGGPHVRRDGAHPGALSGKLVFVSQCHGWIDTDGPDAWKTQRGITHGLVEDFVNPEAADQYLLEYLEGAGADVFTLRESDLQTEMVIVDEGDGTAFPANGTYVETGDPGAFAPSDQVGFANFQTPYGPADDPFRDTGGSARLLTTSATETARATWAPVIPQSGAYRVAIAYTRDGAARASDAHYVVRHAGGETHFRVDQERHGWVWVELGRFWFEAGFDPARAAVVLANDSGEPGDTVSADAVRFGGGAGDVLGEHHFTTSGRPRWEEGARVYTQYMGAPESVWGSGDVTARSKFAAWEHFSSEDSVYVSWHSNAFDGSVRGTSSYVYSANPPGGTYDPGQSVPGSAELMNRIHDEIVRDVRAAWDPAWVDRGYRSAYFGELNPSHNPEMPAALFEVAFHDQADDAEQLAHPRFRQILARAIYQGIVHYFASRDGTTPRLLPEPPRALSATRLDGNTARIAWEPSPTDAVGVLGDPATGYRVYLGSGLGFDEGTPTTELHLDISGLDPSAWRTVRVTATNDGGESLPSETLAFRLGTAPGPRILLVAGFDRLDRGLLLVTEEPDLGGTVLRMFLEEMNRGDALVAHADALEDPTTGFDAASNEAVDEELVPLVPSVYDVVVWALGEESTADETFSSTEQERVAAYLAAGGSLLVSGAEVAWDLDHLGSSADRDFYRNVLRSEFLADDADVHEGAGADGSSLAGIPSIPFDDGSHGQYDVEWPDVVGPGIDAITAVEYVDGRGPAGVQADTGTYRLVNLGFPVETIYPTSTRAGVMAAAIAFLRSSPADDLLFRDGFEDGGTAAWDAALP